MEGAFGGVVSRAVGKGKGKRGGGGRGGTGGAGNIII